MTESLFPIQESPDIRRVNSRFSVRTEDGVVLVWSSDGPVMSFHAGDTASRDLAIVQICMHGGATEDQVAYGFNVSSITVSRAKRDFREGGAAALLDKPRAARGPSKLTAARQRAMLRLAQEGHIQKAIAVRLGVNQSTVCVGLKKLGFVPPLSRATPLPLPLSTPQEAPADDDSVGLAVQTAESCAVLLPELVPPAASVDSPGSGGSLPPETRPELPAADGPGIAKEETVAQPATTKEALPPLPSATDVPCESSMDVDPEFRAQDRLFARMGLLDDAPPLFGNHQKLPHAGVLLAIPLLVCHHFFRDTHDVFKSIGPAFYGVRNTTMSLLLMFLLRIRRPESFKEHPPADLGALIGLDRCPEMKTLRRKIHRLAGQGRSMELMERMTRRHLQRISGAEIWLYYDGHVSVYSGQAELKKEHVTRLRTSLPAVLDYWITDGGGDPVMVITGAPQKSMKTLPALVSSLRAKGERRPMTLVFDREGWSPAMFAELASMDGVFFLTYRKALANQPLAELAHSEFAHHEIDEDGELWEYRLADQEVTIDYGSERARRQLPLRQVTRLMDNGHQVHVLTNHRRWETVEVARRMFGRWSEENFFKYTRNELSLDALYTYNLEKGDDERLVANPVRQELTAKIRQLEAARDALAAEYGGRALTNEEQRRPTMRGFKIANGDLGIKIRAAEERLVELRAACAALPARVPVKETLDGQPAQQVNLEVRRLVHCFRMAAYRTESALREFVRPNYPRWRQDGRTLVQSMLQASGDIEVTRTELRVVMEPLSAPHRTRVLASLCADLSSLAVTFPGSSLRMSFAVKETGRTS